PRRASRRCPSRSSTRGPRRSSSTKAAASCSLGLSELRLDELADGAHALLGAFAARAHVDDRADRAAQEEHAHHALAVRELIAARELDLARELGRELD